MIQQTTNATAAGAIGNGTSRRLGEQCAPGWGVSWSIVRTAVRRVLASHARKTIRLPPMSETWLREHEGYYDNH
jgi:hypothetical protein